MAHGGAAPFAIFDAPGRRGLERFERQARSVLGIGDGEFRSGNRQHRRTREVANLSHSEALLPDGRIGFLSPRFSPVGVVV